LRKVFPGLVIVVAAFIAGCQPLDGPAPPGSALSADFRPKIPAHVLTEVIDGPGLAEPYEQFVERAPVIRVIQSIGSLLETALREKADIFTYDTLTDKPEESRGKIVFAYLIIGEIRDLPFRTGDLRLKVLIGGTPQGEFYAFIFPERVGQSRLYGGDVVWCTGMFVKAFSFIDGSGVTRRVPLLAGPRPTYTKDWFPYKALLRELGLQNFFPVRLNLSAPPPALFIDLDASGVTFVNGGVLGHDELIHRLDGLSEAASIRGVQGVILLRHPDAVQPAELVAVEDPIAGHGLVLIERVKSSGAPPPPQPLLPPPVDELPSGEPVLPQEPSMVQPSPPPEESQSDEPAHKVQKSVPLRSDPLLDELIHP